VPKITAKGKYLGGKIMVECFPEHGSIVIELDGQYDKLIQDRFNKFLKTAPAMGGTYLPPEDSMLAAYSVLEGVFFDDGSQVELEVEGDIGIIPYEDGIVY
jgi:hypothetical protein